MNSTRIRAIAFLLVALVGVLGAYAWTPRVHLSDLRGRTDLETLFPKQFGEWRLDPHMPAMLVSPDTEALLNKLYNQTLSRTYVRPGGDRIMLSVAYGGDQSDGSSAHRPEVCYPAAGFELLKARSTQIQLAGAPLKVRELVAKQGGRIEPITYWIVVGDGVALTGTDQKLTQLRYSMRGIVPDGMLVRVSNISAEPDEAFKIHLAFLSELHAALKADQSLRVFGALGGPGLNLQASNSQGAKAWP